MLAGPVSRHHRRGTAHRRPAEPTSPRWSDGRCRWRNGAHARRRLVNATRPPPGASLDPGLAEPSRHRVRRAESRRSRSGRTHRSVPGFQLAHEHRDRTHRSAECGRPQRLGISATSSVTSRGTYADHLPRHARRVARSDDVLTDSPRRYPACDRDLPALPMPRSRRGGIHRSEHRPVLDAGVLHVLRLLVERRDAAAGSDLRDELGRALPLMAASNMQVAATGPGRSRDSRTLRASRAACPRAPDARDPCREAAPPRAPRGQGQYRARARDVRTELSILRARRPLGLRARLWPGR